MKRYVLIGLAVVGGAALIEAALVPGLLIGGAAVLAPRYLNRRRRQTAAKPVAQRRAEPSRLTEEPHATLVGSIPSLLPKSAFGQAVAKTITFRAIVTTLDFTTNYIVIGELATAAGLSTFNLIAGPLFYFGHEAVWNYLGGPETTVALPAPDGEASQTSGPFTISRALAKTITYRTIATVVDFTTNYVVVGNVTDAVILSSTGFVLGPFVYFGHEKAWEYFSSRVEAPLDQLREIKLLPAPA